ncbi:MAG: low molecular weight phosphotyrosine protein phosphatase [Solobacterium sp.]|nr:low molecular weight phosphotyrosine protein phosphatase [Solobacterium sp.]
MVKVLFVCHGNVCRSPAAEFVMKNLVEKEGLQDYFEIASAATSREELGNGVYPNMKEVLHAHGLNTSGKYARQMNYQDYVYYDYLIGMDEENRYYMERICQGDEMHKISLLLDYSDYPRELSDPWYSREFEKAYQEVVEGCTGLLNYLKKKGIE